MIATLQSCASTAPATDASSGLIALVVGLGAFTVALYGAGVVALCQLVRERESERR